MKRRAFLITFGILPFIKTKLRTSRTVPGAPTNINVKISGNTSTVSFTPPANNGNDGPVKYLLTANRIS